MRTRILAARARSYHSYSRKTGRAWATASKTFWALTSTCARRPCGSRQETLQAQMAMNRKYYFVFCSPIRDANALALADELPVAPAGTNGAVSQDPIKAPVTRRNYR